MLVTGDVAVRAAHSLVAHPDVAEVVVIGPATSKSFDVVDDAKDCDFLIGHGKRALSKAKPHDVPLIWDGASDFAHVWGASPAGLTLAMSAREKEPRLVAVAHTGLEGGSDQMVDFPKPVGRLPAADGQFAGKHVAQARSNEFAACLVEGQERSVSIVDHGAFLAGVALAAAIACSEKGGPVWDNALPYLQASTLMGLVMAEDV